MCVYVGQKHTENVVVVHNSNYFVSSRSAVITFCVCLLCESCSNYVAITASIAARLRHINVHNLRILSVVIDDTHEGHFLLLLPLGRLGSYNCLLPMRESVISLGNKKKIR